MRPKIKNFIAFVDNVTPQSPAAIVALALVTIGAVGVADYFTGHRIHLSIFYFIPILYVSWFAGFRFGSVCSVVAAGVWIVEEIVRENGFPLTTGLWNAFGSLTIFLSSSWMFDRLHQMSKSKLQEAEEKYVHIVENVVEGIMTVDTSGSIRFVNQRMERMLQCAPRSLMGTNILELVHENESRNRLASFLNNGQGSGAPEEVQFVRSDGSALWALVISAKPKITHPGFEGKPLFIIDITSTIQAQQELQKSNKRVVNILESINDAFFALDEEWRFTYLNPKAEQYLSRLNRTVEQLIGKNLWEEFPSDPDSSGYRLFHQAVSEQVPVEFETFYPPINGWFEIHAYPFQEGLSVYVRDITDRKQAEEELRERYEKITAMEQLSEVMVRSLRLDYRLQGAVETVLEVTKFEAGCIYLVDKPGALLHLRYQKGFTHNLIKNVLDKLVIQGVVGQAAQRGEAYFIEDVENHPMFGPYVGQLESVLAFASIPITSKGRVLGVLNISRRARYEFSDQERLILQAFGNQIGIAVENAQLFEGAKEQARKIRQLSIDLTNVQEEERKHFARELHDGLSQTLTILKLNAEMSLRQGSDDLEKGREFLKEVIELADEAQAEAKEIAYDLRPTVLDDFGIKSAISLLATKFQRRTGITTRVDMPPDNLRFESLVESTVYRIIQELLTNVAKHSGATEVGVQMTTENGMMQLMTADNGKGIQPTARQTSDPVLSGRGLRNIRERLEVLGGTLRIESEGSGTNVCVEIPLKPWSI